MLIVDYTDNLGDITKEIEKKKLDYTIIFNITIKDKNSYRKDLDIIKKTIKDNKFKEVGLRINLESFDNFIPGAVSNLKNDFNLIIGHGGTNKLNRYFLENTKIDLLQDPQNTLFEKKIDFMHHLNSGINHVLCKIAKDNNIGFLFTLNFSKNKKAFTKEYARINQNLTFARKYNVGSAITFAIRNKYHIRDIKEHEDLANLFDISTKQRKTSASLIGEIVAKNKLKKSKEYITEGITLDQ